MLKTFASVTLLVVWITFFILGVSRVKKVSTGELTWVDSSTSNTAQEDQAVLGITINADINQVWSNSTSLRALVTDTLSIVTTQLNSQQLTQGTIQGGGVSRRRALTFQAQAIGSRSSCSCASASGGDGDGDSVGDATGDGDNAGDNAGDN
eukprot:Hpha_TRINITY_DN15497_c1_g1::TRINITY_DN15497_c1_g1_i1::g.176252::m.176252